MSEIPLLHPEVERLAEDIALLREELTLLLTELDQLNLVVRPNLLALYQARIGGWELRLLQARGDFARLRREVELIQTSLNHGLPPDLREIERRVELEFLDWRDKVREAAGRLLAAERRLKNPLTPEEDREFKKLYYELVKRLHPDANPGLSEAQTTLWHRVQHAYSAGDANELRALALLGEATGVATPVRSLEARRAARTTLTRQITELLARIEALQQQPPFALAAALADEAWLATRRQELESQIVQMTAQTAALKAHRQQLFPGESHGPGPGKN